MAQGYIGAPTQWTDASIKTFIPCRIGCIRYSLRSRGVPDSVINTICTFWRKGTEKQYSLAWSKWCVWCAKWKHNPVRTSEVIVPIYLQNLIRQGKSYSVINTHKSMLLQTLRLLNNKWCDNPLFISRFMKGYFNQRPPCPRYNFTWRVSKVLDYLRTMFPLCNLSLKMLTLSLLHYWPYHLSLGLRH